MKGFRVKGMLRQTGMDRKGRRRRCRRRYGGHHMGFQRSAEFQGVFIAGPDWTVCGMNHRCAPGSSLVFLPLLGQVHESANTAVFRGIARQTP